MSKVSIIVPVYNVEQYINRCVSSLLQQSYDDIEVILVDDGSPDNSGMLCDAIAKTDDRVVVLHQPNRGVSVARNQGIEAATGDWICFCDGDDWYEPDYVEKMVRCAREQDSDYVICNYKVVTDDRQSLVSDSVSGLVDCYDRKTLIAIGPISSWSHLIQKELFMATGVRYPEGSRQYEELPVIPVLAKHASKIAVLNEPLYNYYQRGDGTSASNVAVQSEENFRSNWMRMCSALGEEYHQEAEYHAVYALLYGEVLNMCKRGLSAKNIRWKIETFELEFPNYRNNPYLASMGRAKGLFLLFAHLKWVPGLRLLSWVHSKIVS